MGKNILITGGTSGLGRALVLKLAARGAFITVIGRNDEKLASISNKNIRGLNFDLSRQDELVALSDFIKQEGAFYDVVIMNAGLGYFKSFESHTAEEIREIYDVNLTNTAVLLHTLLPYIYPHGSIAVIASQAARVTTPFGAVYASSKAGIYALMNALRIELSQHVMTVNPGPIATEFFQKADETGLYEKKTRGIQLDKERLADEIITGLIHKKIEVNRPRWMHHGLTLYQLAPRLIEKYFEKPFMSKNFKGS